MIPRYVLVQITDLHLVPEGCLLHSRLDTFDVLTRTLAMIEQAALAPAALLITGDLTEAGEPRAYQRLRDLMEKVAGRVGTQALYTMGNHDDRRALREHLLGEAPNDEPYDHVTELGGLRVIALDSTVPGQHYGELSDDQLSWLAAQLSRPAPDGTVLALHHPPLPSPSRLAAAIELRDRDSLADVLAGSDVRLIIAGHTHVVSSGTLAGIPVWTGGTTAFAEAALVPTGHEQLVLSPTATRIDLYDDSLIVSAVMVDAEDVVTLTPNQVDAMLDKLARTAAAR